MASVARSAVAGGAALLLRQVITFGFSLVASVLLSRILTPTEFGAYAMIMFVAALSRLVVDGGLASTLVHQTDEPTEIERSTVLGLQSVISIAVFVLLKVLTPTIASLFVGPPNFEAAIRWASVSVLAAPILSVCFAILERGLQFGRVGLLLSIQPIFFSISAVLLAVAGWGVLGLGISLTVSTFFVIPFAMLSAHLMPRFKIRRDAMRGRFRFGIPFIGANVVSTLKDSVNPIFMGAIFGATIVGYINWAQQVAVIGVYLLFALSRLLFPLFARLRSDPRVLENAVSRAVFWCNAAVAPIAVFTIINVSDITNFAFDPKWTPAIPTLLLLSISNLISPTMVVLMALMNALGRTSVPLFYSLAWMAGTWVLVPLFSGWWGFSGYGWANIAVGLFGVPLIVVSRKYLPFRRYYATFLPWVLAVVSMGVVRLVQQGVFPVSNIWILSVSAFVSVLVFAGLMLVFSRKNVMEVWMVVKNVRT